MYNERPKDDLYTRSESGHIDSDTYFRYIHIEHFLNNSRPVVIFHDNLACHGADMLEEFCVKN